MWRPLILQHLLLGINAHINLDLGIAAAQTSPGDDLPDLRNDFVEINRVLVRQVDGIRERSENYLLGLGSSGGSIQVPVEP